MGLGSILGVLGGAALAPFTGGMSILPTLTAIGGAAGGLADVFGGASKSGQAANQNQDALRIALANAQLGRDKFATDAPGQRLAQSTKASILSNFTPTKMEWGGPGSGLKGQIPTYSGGFQGGLANLNPETKALANRVMHDQLVAQMGGGASGGRSDFAMPQIGHTSGMDKIIGGAGLGSSILAALSKMRNNGGVPIASYGGGDWGGG